MAHDPISFYIPARNAERTLEACITAVRRQTRAPDEFFILADPRSTDRTLAIARKSGVRVVEQTGSTLGAARNQAILAAAHRWVACCDSDVLIAPDWLEKLAARRFEGAAGIGGRTTERVLTCADAWRALHMPHHWGEHAFRNPFMLVSEVLFDRNALLAAGGYRNDLNYYEDSDLCQRLREAGYDLLYEPRAAAVHQRSDDLIGVLNLRWKYSEYRQRHLLDRYAGLLDKCRVNREYATSTLSRSLVRRHEELTYISFLLFFHHLLMDFRSMLSRRPLTGESEKQACERQLLSRAMETAALHHHRLAKWLSADLMPLCGPGDNMPSQLHVPPAWPVHLAAVGAAVDRFCELFGAEILTIVEASARYCHGRLPGERIPRFTLPSPEALRCQLQRLPITACVDESFCASLRSQWPGTAGVLAMEPILQTEREVLDRHFGRSTGPPRVTIFPHLEARPDPLGVFADMDAATDRLVLCYRPPASFVAGLDIVTPADLASAAAKAGWTIDRFETLVGRTRLMLSRDPAPGTTGPRL